MRALALLGSLTLLGCFSPKFSNGQLKCGSASHPCPDGYYCAENKTCWQNNAKPAIDMSALVDMAVAIGDMPSGDMLSADMPPSGVRHQGQTCGAANTCDNGNFCVDGYCCNSPCANTCQACNVPGNLGICSNVGIGGSPVGARSCNAEAATTCGRDGKCDGQGNCRDWPSGTACSMGTCDTATGNFVNASTCNGSGSCVANGGGNCAPFKCQDTTQCYQTCSSAAQCSGSNMCMGGSCGQLPDGRKCSSGSQCVHGNCVDGYCCNTSCMSNCQACDVSGSLGMCTTIVSGLPHNNMNNTFTRACTNQGSTPCGGLCDGQSADCSYTSNTMPCGQTCTSGQLQDSFCDTKGSCTAATPTSCPGNFECVGSACLTKCSTTADCDSGYACTSGNGNKAGVCAIICVFDNAASTFDTSGCVFN